jgi:hypothetical protein
VHLVSRLLVFDIIVSIKVRRIIIKYVSCTLGRVTQTLLFQTINLLESLFLSKLEPAFYDDGMMSETSKIVFKDVTGLAKALANPNMISLDRRGRHEFHGIVKASDGLNGGL